MPPHFSIIIPTYNRCDMLDRVLRSCFIQDFADYEVIVVDDASTDRTMAVLQRETDPRLRILRAEQNAGPSRARNLGIAAAQGQWCVMLDSDFELLDGALRVLAAQCASAPPDVGNLASMCIWDVGPDTPYPAPDDTLLLDYVGYLQFLEGLHTPEWFNCVRTDVFSEVRYPDARASEGTFHLDLALRWRFQLFKKCLVKIHTDAPNRITSAHAAINRDHACRDALELATQAELVLATHGEAMARHAPMLFQRYRLEQVYYLLIAARRKEAMDGLWRSPRIRLPVSRSLQFALGFLSPHALLMSKALASHARRQFQDWKKRHT